MIAKFAFDIDTLPTAILVAIKEALGIKHLDFVSTFVVIAFSTECEKLFVVERTRTMANSVLFKWRSIHPDVPMNVVYFGGVALIPPAFV